MEAALIDRFRILEFWRVFAAMLVMTFHYLNYGPESAVRATERLISLLPLMDMFFMVSGFLIMMRYGDRLLTRPGSYLMFLMRRVARFYPLYLVTLAFFVGIGIIVNLGIVSSSASGRYDFSALPANLLLIQGWGFTDTLTFNYVGWTLSAEWFCYLALPVIVLIHRYGGKLGLAALIVACFAALEAATRAGIIPFESWLVADTWGAYRAFADFAIGALVASLVATRTLKLRSHLPGWIAFAASLYAMWFWWDGYVVLGLLALAALLASIAEANNPEGSRWMRIFDPLGRITLTIYLVHPVVATLMLGVVWRMILAPSGTIGFYVYLPVVIAVTLLASFFIHHLFEGWAAKRVLGWFEKSSFSAPASATAR